MSKALSTLTALDAYIRKEFDLSYEMALGDKTNYLTTLASEAPANGRVVRFPFFQNSTTVRAFNEGEPVQFDTLKGEYVEIALKKFAQAIEIPKLDFENKLYQTMLTERTQGIATQMAWMPWERIITALVEGNTNAYYTMWDGQLFFSNTHSIFGQAYDNLLAGALNKANFIAAKTTLRNIPAGPDGRFLPMGNAKFYLIVPPALAYDAYELINNSWAPQATFNTENILKAEAEIIVDERLTDANDWYLCASLPSMKPFVHLRHEGAAGSRTLVSQIRPEDENVYNLDAYRWLATSFEECFPSQFYLCVKVVN